MFLAIASLYFVGLPLYEGTGVLCRTSGGAQSFGYQEVGGTNKYFYTVIEANKDPKNSPTFIVLPGGPGLSAMGLTLTGMEPCLLNENGTLQDSMYSWTKFANGIWVDAPGTTGFSQGKVENTMEEWVDNLFILVSGVLKKYPTINHKVYLVAISFDASTAGMLAAKISRSKAAIDLRGIFMMSGLTGPTDIYLGCLMKARKEGLVLYDVRVAPGAKNLEKMFKYKTGNPTVQKAMGVSKKWVGLDRQVLDSLTRFGAYNTTASITEALDAGLRILVVHGDADYITNAEGGLFWMSRLAGRFSYGKQLNAAPEQPLKVGDEMIGTARMAKFSNNAKFGYVKVKDSGHMLLRNRPRGMKVLANKFMSFAE
ncbi:hypothetical protein FOL47_004876 [Perkinsus chesapeaki]|uniref:Thymus-specific serine protease n=1 Tax=Perkinsus chesapeaki TaxID=330153 RepID=A0A7J6M048_PERCH|nr:hypothetical protein FOL47_004876 [Perkinsus chesapeaki]